MPGTESKDRGSPAARLPMAIRLRINRAGEHQMPVRQAAS